MLGSAADLAAGNIPRVSVLCTLSSLDLLFNPICYLSYLWMGAETANRPIRCMFRAGYESVRTCSNIHEQ